jgi:hypothetical protein
LSWDLTVTDTEKNNFTQRQDNCPNTLTKAYNLLVHWKQDPWHLMRVLGASNDGVAFANIGANADADANANANATKNEGKGKQHDKSHITCHKWGIEGHYANKCPELEKEKEQESGVQLLMAGVLDNQHNKPKSSFLTAGVESKESKATSFHQQDEQGNGYLPNSWILLDNQSTMNDLSNKKMLKNLRETDRVMNIMCKAGVTRAHIIGDWPGYDGKVWYNPIGFANILSLSNVEKYHQVTCKSKVEKAFTVHKEEGSNQRFKQSSKGLFYLNTNEYSGAESLLLNTVLGNKIKYTNKSYNKAKVARKIQNMIGRPSLQDCWQQSPKGLPHQSNRCTSSGRHPWTKPWVAKRKKGKAWQSARANQTTRAPTRDHGAISEHNLMCQHHVRKSSPILHHGSSKDQIWDDWSPQQPEAPNALPGIQDLEKNLLKRRLQHRHLPYWQWIWSHEGKSFSILASSSMLCQTTSTFQKSSDTSKL